MKNLIRALKTFKFVNSIRKFLLKLDVFFGKLLGRHYKWFLMLIYKYLKFGKRITRYFWYLNVCIALFYYVGKLLHIEFNLDLETLIFLFYFILSTVGDKIFDLFDIIVNGFYKLIEKLRVRRTYELIERSKGTLREQHRERMLNKKILKPVIETEEITNKSWYSKFIPNYSISDIPTWVWVVTIIGIGIGIVVFYPSIFTTVKDWLSNYFFPKPEEPKAPEAPDLPPFFIDRPINSELRERLRRRFEKSREEFSSITPDKPTVITDFDNEGPIIIVNPASPPVSEPSTSGSATPTGYQSPDNTNLDLPEEITNPFNQ